MNPDEKELMEKLSQPSEEEEEDEGSKNLLRAIFDDYEDEDEEEGEEEEESNGYHQWTTADSQSYFPASSTCSVLPPGAYEICQNHTTGTYFEKVTVKTIDLIRFPDSNSNKVISEIKLFWESKDQFAKYKIPYKRGICLWGPPGSGKSCTLKFVMHDVIERGGVVIKFTHPDLFLRGYRIFREVQKDTPVVVIMEDLDSILDDYSESSVLNILDGAVDEVANVVFLATTNYPEKLGARIINRPSRFDRRFKIGFPGEDARRVYFEHLFKDHEMKDAVDLDKWVKDTEEMSIAHLGELFVAVVILGNDYDDSIEILQAMDSNISSDQDGGTGLGF